MDEPGQVSRTYELKPYGVIESNGKKYYTEDKNHYIEVVRNATGIVADDGIISNIKVEVSHNNIEVLYDLVCSIR